MKVGRWILLGLLIQNQGITSEFAIHPAHPTPSLAEHPKSYLTQFLNQFNCYIEIGNLREESYQKFYLDPQNFDLSGTIQFKTKKQPGRTFTLSLIFLSDSELLIKFTQREANKGWDEIQNVFSLNTLPKERLGYLFPLYDKPNDKPRYFDAREPFSDESATFYCEMKTFS